MLKVRFRGLCFVCGSVLSGRVSRHVGDVSKYISIPDFTCQAVEQCKMQCHEYGILFMRQGKGWESLCVDWTRNRRIPRMIKY
jgi:hypothetical protein